jgi:hypothetical protein
MLIYGDFNFSHTWYEAIDIGGGVAIVGHVTDERPGDLRFQTCLNESNLGQLVTFPTYRKTRNDPPVNTLDLIILDDPDRLIEIKELDSFAFTEMGQAHCMLSCEMAVAGKTTSPNTTKPRFIWSKADFTSLSNYIGSFDWVTLFQDRSVNECYELLTEKYNEATKLHIPTTTTPFKAKHSIWVTPEVLVAVELKRSSWAPNFETNIELQART